MATTTTMSGAAYDHLPLEEGRHLELLHGEVIEVSRPTPEHQTIVAVLNGSLMEYFRRQPGGWSLADCEFALAEDTRLCPDVAILLEQRWARIDRKKSPILLPPDIALEVLSPTERSTDSQRKLSTYLKSGVREVWQVVPEGERILIYTDTNSFTILDINQSLRTPLLPGWEIWVRELFGV